MKAIRRLGNNAIVALDNNNNEVILLGRGIASVNVPGELTDMSKVEKTFYGVNNSYMEMISSISPEVLMAASDVIEQAEFNLDCHLNPNLTFTLADHLQFALSRFEKNQNITVPLSYDVKHIYKEEYELGLLALDVLEDYTKIRLPEGEAINVAMHILGGEAESGTDIHSTMEILKVVDEICEIVEDELHFSIDSESYEYSRFLMHLRYLIQRQINHEQLNSPINDMLSYFKKEYPLVYLSATKIAKHLEKSRGWQLNNDEIVYLIIHIVRLQNKN